MDNENNPVESVEETTEEVVEEAEETTEESESREKSQESPEAKKARLERQLKQLGKKNPELFGEKKTKASKKPTGLDYGQKAFLLANEIKGAEETSLVNQFMQETGKDLEGVIESKYFQSELKELRELGATANANPNGSNRSAQSAQDTVEYWVAKGELPPATDVQLRRDVVNARLKKTDNKGTFYNS